MSPPARRPLLSARPGMRLAFDRRALVFRLRRSKSVAGRPRPLTAFTRKALALRGERNRSR